MVDDGSSELFGVMPEDFLKDRRRFRAPPRQLSRALTNNVARQYATVCRLHISDCGYGS